MVGVLILILGVASVWVWQKPEPTRALLRGMVGSDREAEARASALEERLAKLEQRPTPDTTLAGRVAKLEQQPAPPDPSTVVAPLTARVDTLERRPPPVPADLKSLTTRVEALESRAATPLVATSGTDLRPLVARIEALEARASRPTVDPARVEELEKLAARPRIDPARIEALEQFVAHPQADPAKVDALAARVDALAGRDSAADLRPKVDALEKQVTALAATANKVNEVSDRAARLARLRAAETALTTGQKLGTIPNAPPALARFADAPAPTETELRLKFPAAARAALAVSTPDVAGKPFLDRMLARLQDFHFVTVRQGDDVVIGNLTAETLGRAHALLEAGDLSGAIKAVSTLSGASAEAMAPWLTDAKALLAAREALASLVEKG